MVNYELLKDAYAIIDGIPDKQFNLNRWVDDNERTATCNLATDCNMIACAGGWLSLHPQFNKLGLDFTWKRGNGRGGNCRRLTYKGNDYHYDAYSVLARVFNMDYQQAQSLFSSAGSSQYDNMIYYKKGRINHKKLFQYRVKSFLNEFDPSYNKRVF